MSLYTVLAVCLAVVATVSGEECKCPTNIQKYYKELNCNPVTEGGGCCPTKFDCGTSLTNRSPAKCHLRGAVFEPETTITSEQAGNVCVPNCRCSKFGKQATFICTHNDCPELFDGRLEEGCVRLYKPGQCCSTGTHCTSETSATTTKAKDAFTCAYAGKSYVTGQQFYPADAPCKKCICQQGFDGTLNGPWCTEVSCGIEIHYAAKILDGCAPIFFGEKGCCPIGWRCPESGDSVVPAQAGKASTARSSTAKCTFGSLQLNVLDTLNKKKNCVTCACSVPPHVSCVQKGYC